MSAGWSREHRTGPGARFYDGPRQSQTEPTHEARAGLPNMTLATTRPSGVIVRIEWYCWWTKYEALAAGAVALVSPTVSATPRPQRR